jgi:hypothetical protein
MSRPQEYSSQTRGYSVKLTANVRVSVCGRYGNTQLSYVPVKRMGSISDTNEGNELETREKERRFKIVEDPDKPLATFARVLQSLARLCHNRSQVPTNYIDISLYNVFLESWRVWYPRSIPKTLNTRDSIYDRWRIGRYFLLRFKGRTRFLSYISVTDQLI